MERTFGNVQEMFEKLGGDVLINLVVLGEFQSDAHQVEAVHRHPTGAVGLVDKSTGGQGRAAVENADIVQTQKAALENISALGVLAIHPPGEIEHQFVEDALEESEVSCVAALLAVHLEYAPGCPGMDGRVNIA